MYFIISQSILCTYIWHKTYTIIKTYIGMNIVYRYNNPNEPLYTPYNKRNEYNSRQPLQPLQRFNRFRDYGPEPFVIDIEDATENNTTFRTALWTGEYLQLTLMSINPGDDIGLEVHRDHDQFIRIEDGQGIIRMGDSRDRLDFQVRVSDDDAIIIPAGKWHNLINTGRKPLKLYSIYAPPEHPRGTIQERK